MLSLVGVVVVGYFAIVQYATAYIPWWVFAAGIISIICWLIVGDRPILRVPPRADVAITVAMIVFGAIGAAPSNGLLIVPAAIGVMRLIGDPDAPLLLGGGVALIAMALSAIGSLTVTITVLGLLSLEGGLFLGALGGVNRRQGRAAAVRERQLLESTVAAREEHARASALEARQRVARDIHDVLAHSLGGMVVQLDAVEALLESGHLDEAETRVRDARSLAASGLGEARRAVDALRSPTEDSETVDMAELDSWLSELVSAHRSMGGVVVFTTAGTAAPTAGQGSTAGESEPSASTVAEPVAVAIRRALQESLSNARKHAPGAPVTARLEWQPSRVVLTVSNPVGGHRVGRVRAAPSGAGLAASGGGNGLAGMTERFAALPHGAVSAGVRDDCFVVRAEAGLT